MDSDSAPGPSVTAAVVVPAVTSAQAELLRSLKVKFVSKHFNHRVQNYSCRFFYKFSFNSKCRVLPPAGEESYLLSQGGGCGDFFLVTLTT